MGNCITARKEKREATDLSLQPSYERSPVRGGATEKECDHGECGCLTCTTDASSMLMPSSDPYSANPSRLFSLHPWESPPFSYAALLRANQ
jgi:hypothetical protein